MANQLILGANDENDSDNDVEKPLSKRRKYCIRSVQSIWIVGWMFEIADDPGKSIDA